VSSYGQDDFLGDMHSLLLMDDTTILATSRQAMIEKLALLSQCADRIGMQIHPEKSQYIVVNSADTSPFFFDDRKVRHTASYTYLGTPPSNKPVQQHVIDHIATKQKHVSKYLAFLYKNSDAPFCVKKKVLDSALTSSILYSAETWLVDDLTAARKPYLASVKALLGVRVQTASDLLYAELDIPSIECLIMKRQLNFFRRSLESPSFNVSPLKSAMDLATAARTPMSLYLNKLLGMHDCPLENFVLSLRGRFTHAPTSRMRTYLSLNPDIVDL